MATFFIELRRKGGKIDKIPGAQSKPAIGQPSNARSANGRSRRACWPSAITHKAASRRFWRKKSMPL
jgi:hypothetical protein